MDSVFQFTPDSNSRFITSYLDRLDERGGVIAPGIVMSMAKDMTSFDFVALSTKARSSKASRNFLTQISPGLDDNSQAIIEIASQLDQEQTLENLYPLLLCLEQSLPESSDAYIQNHILLHVVKTSLGEDSRLEIQPELSEDKMLKLLLNYVDVMRHFKGVKYPSLVEIFGAASKMQVLELIFPAAHIAIIDLSSKFGVAEEDIKPVMLQALYSILGGMGLFSESYIQMVLETYILMLEEELEGINRRKSGNEQAYVEMLIHLGSDEA